MHSDYLTEFSINNIVAKSDIVPPFSLSSLSAAFPFPTRDVLSCIFLPFQHVNLSIFNTGSVISRSSRSLSDVKASFHWLSSFLAAHDLELSDQYDIINIAASINLAPSLNLLALFTYLPHCHYDPSDEDHEHLVNCITFHFHEARSRYTALIFPTGNVIFTGFKSIAELGFHIPKLTSLLSEIILNHPEVLAK